MPILGKLRTIQLVGADLQLIMRIFLELSCEEMLDKDIRVSKFNFRLQKDFSIDNTVLEKWLIYGISM